MGYPCPRCGEQTARGQSKVGSAMGGVAGSLIGMALAGFQCPKCGSIPSKEFPEDIRGKILINNILMVGGAVALVILVVILLVVVH